MELRVLFWLLALVPAQSDGAVLDLATAKIFRGDPQGAFGTQVASLKTQDGAWVLVSAPLSHVEASGLGRLYRCHPGSGTCQEVPVVGPPGAVNASLGLALDASEEGVVVCGPRVPKFCGSNVQLRGFCVLLDVNFQQFQSLPQLLPECPKASSDVVFLIDGSGSIQREDFKTMKKFIREVMLMFKDTDTQFALTQFSNHVRHHFDFRTFRNFPDPGNLLAPVRQLGGFTLTATAIQRVLRDQFVPERGSRAEATKVLIVVTDGEKFGDTLGYEDVIPEATARGVTRYAIGVGNAFSRPEALQELHSIASQPSQDHVFRVDNFQALQGIQSQLQEKIFSIEGTSSSQGSSFQLELAQEGISARISPEGPILGAVGAYDWSGGAFVHAPSSDVTFLNLSAANPELRDSYLGYSSMSLSLGGHQAVALGAPRFRHLGRLLLFHRPGASWEFLDEALGTQVGAYFGASLGAVDADGDGEAEVLLVGAPMFYGGDSGGRVALCHLPKKGRGLRCHQELRGQPGHPLGRFGASVGVLGDIDGDGWGEVAVGAPLEDEGHGAVYVFPGTPEGVAPGYSQRIPATSFPTPLVFFGQALVGGGRDLDGDNLPDLAVGAWGQFMILRSPPVLHVHPTVTFDPPEVPNVTFECHEEEEEKEGKKTQKIARAQICFDVTRKTQDNHGPSLSVSLRFRLVLDPGRVRVRAVLLGGAEPGELRLGLGRTCVEREVALKGCPQDTLNPLVLRLEFEGIGDPMGGTGGLRPSLSPSLGGKVEELLPFARNCGDDDVCVDALEVTVEFLGGGPLVLGVSRELELSLGLRNRGEDSHGATLELRHPRGFSYRKVQKSPGSPLSLRCHSEPPQGPLLRTLCAVTPSPFRAQHQLLFTLTLDVPSRGDFGDTLGVVANVTSDNGTPGMVTRAEVALKYGVLVLLSSSNSTSYLEVTPKKGGGDPPAPPLLHHYEVKILGRLGPPLNVTFWVPIGQRGGNTPIWEQLGVTPMQDEIRCWEGSDLPGVPGPPPKTLPDPPVLECPGVPCREFRCEVGEGLEPPQTLGVTLGGRLEESWGKELAPPQVILRSLGQISFDLGRYQNLGRGGEELQVETLLERLEPPKLLPPILGGSLGGLVLLALAVWGLQKVGFFKRRYKELLETPPDPQAQG